MRKTTTLLAAGLGAALGLWAMGAHAQERVLKAVSAFNEGSLQSINFEQFIDEVNAAGKGVVRLNYIGGPKAVPPFELANAVRTGVVDVANVTGAFYSKSMPEADALKLSEMPGPEMRKNGAWAYINELHNAKLNVWYLARAIDNIPFHLYLNKPIDKPDLTGLRLRVTPVYRDFFTALGATVMQTSPGEVYTALERGVVDGYGWPITGIFDMGWQEKTKYRLDPGFYRVDVGILVNLDVWKKLSEAEKAIFNKAAQAVEERALKYPDIGKEEAKKQAAAGLQTITLKEADAKIWLAKAKETGWKTVIDQAPETGAKLKSLITKP